MNKEKIFEIITRHASEVVPNLADHQFRSGESLKNLGANSVDRSEIIMMTMESLSLRVPMIEFARAENIGELVDIFHEKL